LCPICSPGPPANGVRTILVETATGFARVSWSRKSATQCCGAWRDAGRGGQPRPSFLDEWPHIKFDPEDLGAVSEFDIVLRPSHPNDFNHTFQWLAELTGKAGRVVSSSTKHIE